MTDRGDKPVVVGLLTDPGLAATIARYLADDLADRLAGQVDDRVSWRVEVVPDEPFEVFYDADRIIDKARQRVEGTGGTSPSRSPTCPCGPRTVSSWPSSAGPTAWRCSPCPPWVGSRCVGARARSSSGSSTSSPRR